MNKRWLLPAIGVPLIAVMVGGSPLGGQRITETPEYAECEAAPSAKCMISLAVAALPDGYEFERWTGIAAAFASAGMTDFVLNRISRRADSSIRDSIARIEFVQLARRSPSALPENAPDPGFSYYLSALQLVHDHHKFGGGYSPVVEAEKAAFSRRLPLATSVEMRALLDRWRGSLNRTSRPRSREWTNLAKVLVRLGDHAGALEAAVLAADLPQDPHSGDLILLLAELGEVRRAGELAANLDGAKYRALVQVRLTHALSQAGKHAESLIVASAAEKALTLVERHGDRAKSMRELVSIYGASGDRIRANALAAELYEFARLPHPFRPFFLLDAAGAYIDIGDKEHAAEIISEALSVVPAPDHVVSVGVIGGAYRFDDGELGLLPSLLADAAILSCRVGKIDEAISIAARANEFHRWRAAEEIYACALKMGVPGISPVQIVEELKLGSPFRLYLKLASLQIVADEEDAGARLRTH